MARARTYVGCPHRAPHLRPCPPTMPADPWVESRPYHDRNTIWTATVTLPGEAADEKYRRLYVSVVGRLDSGKWPRRSHAEAWSVALGMTCRLDLWVLADGTTRARYTEQERGDPEGLDLDRLGLALSAVLGGYRLPTAAEGWREQEQVHLGEVLRQLREGIGTSRPAGG